MFQDGGHMTSIRTAAAGALSASLVGNKQAKRLGVIGTGHQAELQAIWISETRDISEISLWGRSIEKGQALAARLAVKGIDVTVRETVEELCAASDIIVTTTPSTTPILEAGHIRKGHHIIALGADSPGKRELDPAILAKADTVFVDDVTQCVDHGELGWAVRQGLLSADQSLPLGKALSAGASGVISENQISVVDLTGLGSQDLALAAYVYEALKLS